jgi:lipopolysaccharide/colanic/teichoic acid biosynthesis glycosyltransferase
VWNMPTITEECKPFEKAHHAQAAMRFHAIAQPKHSWYLGLKIIAEWLTALVLMVLTAPIAVFVAVLVKMTSAGPVFYTQTRLGQGGRQFRIVKFRTMVQNAEAGTGAIWAAKNDCRITAIGQFLRVTHLDELPQLLNVLRGEMSLIGPRPERPEIAGRIARQIPEFKQRLALRPGVTGLAQMLLPADDPNDADLKCVRRKLAHDLRYIREVGILLDLRIALSTPCYFLSSAIHAVQHRLVQSYAVIDADERAANVPQEPSRQHLVQAEATV